MKPLCIDLFCGLGGWTEGFLAEGYEVVGFDIARHVYGTHQYPAQLVLQDVLTLHGSQFTDAAVIVASSPCQAYSYMAMPWSRAKQIARALRGHDEFPEQHEGYRTLEALNALFEAPKRIQREAIEAAGHFIPMIQENVRGAIPWVGRSQWNFGSYHLWGDVPAMMPIPYKAVKVGGFSWSDFGTDGYVGKGFSDQAAKRMKEGEKQNPDGTTHPPGSWFKIADSKNRGARSEGMKVASASGRRTDVGKGARFTSRDCGSEGVKQSGDWFADGRAGIGMSAMSSKSGARKAASAVIAKIPFPLASHIARVYYPSESA